MASIIEQAAQRLEELRLAGIAVPWDAATRTGIKPKGPISQPPSAERPEAGLSGAVAEVTALPTVRPAESAAFEPAANAETASPRIAGAQVVLDIPALERAGHLVPTDARSALAEEFRHIKRPVLRNMRGRKGEGRMSHVMVTSALPGEGKTFCAINLAMSLALEIDLSVILIDADVLRPGVLKRLGLSPHRGLLDLLTDAKLDIADVLLATNVPKLSLISAGTYNRRSAELLDSAAMNRLLDDLAVRFRDHLIVFDAPPLLLTNEAKVLASRVGQVLMVVEASRTQRSAVEKALAAVDQCPAVMCVLNRADEPVAHYGYGDYYG